jgi:pentapeptide MXKDX repeat protein
MKNVNSVMLVMCLALGAGSVFAQDSGMAKDSMTQTNKGHDDMKKDAMRHDAMKKGAMSKDSMAKDGMSKDDKSSGAMKDNMSHDTAGNNSSQH